MKVREWARKLSEFAMRHFRLIEATGLFLILAAWGLSAWSVDEWSSLASSHERDVRDVVETYERMQITANIELESAITRAAVTRGASQHYDGAKPNEAHAQPYQQVWHSGDVRRAWLRRTANNVASLGKLIERLRDDNEAAAVGFGKQIRNLEKGIIPVNDAVQSLLGPQRGWVFAPIPDEDRISSEEALAIEKALSDIINDAFPMEAQLAQVIADRRSWSSRRYAAVFIIGTFMLIGAKSLEWRSDLRQTAR